MRCTFMWNGTEIVWEGDDLTSNSQWHHFIRARSHEKWLAQYQGVGSLGRRKTTILKIHGGRIVEEEKVLQDLAYKGSFFRGGKTLPFIHAQGVEAFMLAHNFWHFRRKQWATRREKYRHLVAKSHGYRIVPYG